MSMGMSESVSSAPPTIAESLDEGETVIPAPPLFGTESAVVVPSLSDFTLPPVKGDNSIMATVIAILIGLWIVKIILGLIPRFILIGIGIAILYAYLH